MGIIRTDQWLDKHFHQPLEICNEFLDDFRETDATRIYEYLQRFGMYRPNRATYHSFLQLKEKQVWDQLDKVYKKYRVKWRGPDVNVYLLPLGQTRSFFTKVNRGNKAGVSFEDRMYLFVDDDIKEAELEALFVHEYHHVCRLTLQKRPVHEYTLLDSMVLEGLAEWEVRRSCGEEVQASWCQQYSEENLQTYWQKYIKDHLTVKKYDPLHDELLFGLDSHPPLLGYSIGYWLVASLFKDKKPSIRQTFLLPARKFLSNK